MGMRRLIPLFIALALLIGLAVVADRVAASIAAGKVADRLQQRGDFTEKPHVSINGFPFFTQVLRHDFGDVEVTAAGYQAGRVTLTDLDAKLRDVRPDSGFNSATIAQVHGTALLSFADLVKAANRPGVSLSSAGTDNQVKVALTQPLSLTATGQLSVADGAIEVRATTIDGRQVPASLASSLRLRVPVTGMPLGMRLSGAEVTDAGVRITVDGQNTSLGSAVNARD
jgi:hypothetical protein